MESKVVQLGSSLIVPCVQELAKVNTAAIPPRYIRPHQEQPTIIPSCEIPVVDLQRLLDQESMDSELAKLHLACKDWGFFQLVNHEVSTSLLERVKTDVQDFFNLPMESKKNFWQYPGEVEGFGQAFVVSEEQKLDWADLFFLVTQPVLARKPHLFPKLPLPFRDTVEAYSSELKNLAITVLGQMAKALKIEAEEVEELFGNGLQSMRMNYYPPCPQPDKVIGLTPHSDAVGLTILLQVNEVEGLQVKKDGKWVPVKPLPNAFIFNIGDVLEHSRATVNSEKERLSIATFLSPNYDGVIGPASSLVTEQTPAMFKSTPAEEYFKGLFARELHEKSYLDVMRT
uniref:Fe2OG dioxygenase domain-containing protein n=1 Tax=Salix viminalis TaxID=40686 RepID=A0A6N2LRE3_SALVM